jgi:hypothetical protein
MREILGGWMDWLRILHGSYNGIIAAAFLYQGWLGLRIRRERKAGKERDFGIVKQHRARGPMLVGLGLLGYCAGIILIFIDKGHLFEYPLHNLVGSLIAFLLVVTYFISRRIKGIYSPWRTAHYIIGGSILCIYILQIFLGLDILF